MVGKNCFAIASDRRLGVQLQTIATDFQRIYKVHDRLFIGLSGLATDAQTLYVRSFKLFFFPYCFPIGCFGVFYIFLVFLYLIWRWLFGAFVYDLFVEILACWWNVCLLQCSFFFLFLLLYFLCVFIASSFGISVTAAMYIYFYFEMIYQYKISIFTGIRGWFSAINCINCEKRGTWSLRHLLVLSLLSSMRKGLWFFFLSNDSVSWRD